MKVLFIVSLYYPHVGGIETMIAELTEHYQTMGIECVVLTKKWPQSLEEEDEYLGTKIYRIKSAKSVEDFLEITNWLIENEPKIKANIIHIVGVRRPLPLMGLLLGKRWKVPVICTIGGGEIPDPHDHKPGLIWNEGRDIIPETLLQSDHVNCVSNALTRDLMQYIPNKNIETLYAGIEFAEIKKIKPSSAYCGNYIFSLRRLDFSKGIDILIKAFALLSQNFESLTLIIAGEGDEEQALKQLARELGMESKIHFIGTVKLEEGISLLKSALMTVVPSRSEGGGLVNVEAQAAGCPVVASRVGGIPEYISEEVSGILFSSENYKELAEKMAELINSPRLRNKIIKGGYEHSKKFDWEHLIPQYIELYKHLLENYIYSPFCPWSDLTALLWNKIKDQSC